MSTQHFVMVQNESTLKRILANKKEEVEALEWVLNRLRVKKEDEVNDEWRSFLDWMEQEKKEDSPAIEYFKKLKVEKIGKLYVKIAPGSMKGGAGLQAAFFIKYLSEYFDRPMKLAIRGGQRRQEGGQEL
jgi:hypothetical protein